MIRRTMTAGMSGVLGILAEIGFALLLALLGLASSLIATLLGG